MHAGVYWHRLSKNELSHHRLDPKLLGLSGAHLLNYTVDIGGFGPLEDLHRALGIAHTALNFIGSEKRGINVHRLLPI